MKRKPARGDWQGLKDLRARLAAEGSLVDDTLHDMKHDKDFQLTAKKLREEGQRKLTLEEKQRRRRCLEELGAPEFTEHLLQQAGCDGTRFDGGFQLNIGLYCNQACNHCHVESESAAARGHVCEGCGHARYSGELAVRDDAGYYGRRS